MDDPKLWLMLASCCVAEHERLWAKHYPNNIEGMKDSLQFQSFALIAGDMADRLTKERKDQ